MHNIVPILTFLVYCLKCLSQPAVLTSKYFQIHICAWYASATLMTSAWQKYPQSERLLDSQELFIWEWFPQISWHSKPKCSNCLGYAWNCMTYSFIRNSCFTGNVQKRYKYIHKHAYRTHVFKCSDKGIKHITCVFLIASAWFLCTKMYYITLWELKFLISP